MIMTTRRAFLERSLFITSALACGTLRTASAASEPFTGIIYTPSNPGKWREKAGSHVPQVSIDGRQVTITTPHPMSQNHYIVRHTLVLNNGTVVGAKTFFPVKDTKAVSTFTLPAECKGAWYATSFCNLHDLWVTEGKL
jgi:superoxide reductase